MLRDSDELRDPPGRGSSRVRMTPMPELPEVENVCLGLAGTVVGQSVTHVNVRRPDVVHGPGRQADMLRGRTVTRIARSGKQLALIGEIKGRKKVSDGQACICIHLGMTGSLRFYPSGEPYKPVIHTHVIWRLSGGGRLAFCDPRRFGGLWTFDSVEMLQKTRWSKLGEDALTITPSGLHTKLQHTRRPIKSALLDQGTLAGLGNIYVDELLFGCGLHPLRPGRDLSRREVRQLVRQMRALLARAIRAGGSTLRDYVNASGQSGGFQLRHKVYGRSGKACPRCGQPLSCTTVSGRTTVFCDTCQS
jgi:formamidopyrimidine-DNA glycosylase